MGTAVSLIVLQIHLVMLLRRGLTNFTHVQMTLQHADFVHEKTHCFHVNVDLKPELGWGTLALANLKDMRFLKETMLLRFWE